METSPDRRKLNSSISDNHSTGYLEIYLGPMMSGKTSIMIAKLKRMCILHCKTVLVNWEKDIRETRGGDGKKFSSHDSCLLSIPREIDCYQVTELSSIFDKLLEYDVIGIDECHFYTDLVKVVEELVEKHSKYVILSGLDGDFRRKPIGNTFELIPLSNITQKLSSECLECIENAKKQGLVTSRVSFPAPFTKKYGDMDKIFDEGGEDKYQPKCRYHFSN